MQAPVRQSNFELLRLVSMFFILILHINNDNGLGIIGHSIPATAFEGFCIVAVNCFVLISGYFSIKVSWKSFLRLFILGFTYTFAFAVFYSIYNQEIQYKRIILSFFTFSHSPYWFVNVYFGLYLLSPLLNKLTNALSKKDFIVYLAILTFINVYMGFFSKNEKFNDSGYNIMNFIYLYFIGRYINIYCNESHHNKKSKYWVIYICCSLIIAGTILVTHKFGIRGIYVLGLNSLNYNSPLVLISSIALFMCFKNIQIKNKTINWFASSALAIYLIHGGLPYGKLFQYLGAHYGNQWFSGIIYFTIASIVFIVCIMIDKIRMLVTNPIEKQLGKIPVEKYIKMILDKI